LVKVRETVAAKELNHFNRARAVIITGNVAPGSTPGEALDFLDRASTEVLGQSFRTDLDGVSREFRESGAGLAFVVLFAALFIYLMLSAQFESFVSPFVIMLTVPLAGLGALLAIWLTGGTLNVYSQIGLITLVGLITKHGILIVEFANQQRQQGLEIFEAVKHAAALRLRPILMTTGAMVLGAVPLALADGAGAESRQQIGWVIVGGMSLGTLLTIFVVPTMYTLFARKSTPGPIKTVVEEGHPAVS
ncbi:MAG TPA: efflux RND transporter permease subunit, partial [Lysobacter sp.]|nr:efflux RND transporter permease subunit [Lysobacter sp.]